MRGLILIAVLLIGVIFISSTIRSLFPANVPLAQNAHSSSTFVCHPGVHIPERQIPEINFPEIHLHGVHIPGTSFSTPYASFSTPSVDSPAVDVPSRHVPAITIPSINIPEKKCLTMPDTKSFPLCAHSTANTPQSSKIQTAGSDSKAAQTSIIQTSCSGTTDTTYGKDKETRMNPKTDSSGGKQLDRVRAPGQVTNSGEGESFLSRIWHYFFPSLDEIEAASNFFSDPTNPEGMWREAFLRQVDPAGPNGSWDAPYNDVVEYYASKGYGPEEVSQLARDFLGPFGQAGAFAGSFGGVIIGERLGNALTERLIHAPSPPGSSTLVESGGFAPGNIKYEPDAFLERGYYGRTSRETYLVRTEGINGKPGTYGVHLFESVAEANAFAKQMAAMGEQQIRNDFAIKPEWNPVDVVRVYKVPSDTQYIQGIVGKQTSGGVIYHGQGPQVVIDRTTHIQRIGQDFFVNNGK